jgi:hypothetical protein
MKTSTILALALSLLPSLARAAEPYCVDNPAVVYCNDFEGGTLDGIEAGPRASIVTAASGAPTYEGEGSLFADFSPPYNADAEFGVRFDGVERLYARFYVRFDATWDEPMHHFYAIHGDRPDDMWSCHGDAGCRPNGELCLSGTTVDTRVIVDGELPGQPFFYTYHPEMNCDPGDTCANYADPQMICDGCAAKGLPCENGLECCWGENLDIDDTSLSLVADTWYAMETMVVANTPGQADGEMSLWVDGVLVGHHDAIRWRDDPALLLNHFIVWNYYPETEIPHSIWFDDLVISTEPIGLLGGTGADTSGSAGDEADDDGSSGGGSASQTAGEGDDDDGGTGPADGSASQGSAGGSSSDAGATDDGDGGCGCNSTPPSKGALLFALLLLSRARSRAPGPCGSDPRAPCGGPPRPCRSRALRARSR